MVIGNLGIMIAYFSISYKLSQAIQKKVIGVIISKKIWSLFAAFIFLCGLTHGGEAAVILLRGYYWEQATLILLTATISIMTAIAFSPAITKLLHGRALDEMYNRHRAIESSPYLPRLERLVQQHVAEPEKGSSQ